MKKELSFLALVAAGVWVFLRILAGKQRVRITVGDGQEEPRGLALARWDQPTDPLYSPRFPTKEMKEHEEHRRRFLKEEPDRATAGEVPVDSSEAN
jgi:hypothetical protein